MSQSEDLPPQTPKDAEPATVRANAEVLTRLPFDDRQDFEDVRRGHIANLAGGIIQVRREVVAGQVGRGGLLIVDRRGDRRQRSVRVVAVVLDDSDGRCASGAEGRQHNHGQEPKPCQSDGVVLGSLSFLAQLSSATSGLEVSAPQLAEELLQGDGSDLLLRRIFA